METQKSNKRLSTKKAAKHLGYSINTLYKFMQKGVIPYSKPSGGKAFFLVSDLEKFLEDGTEAI